MPPVPFVGEQLIGADAVGVVVGDRGDDQLVGAGRLLELLKLVGHLARRACELGAARRSGRTPPPWPARCGAPSLAPTGAGQDA